MREVCLGVWTSVSDGGIFGAVGMKQREKRPRTAPAPLIASQSLPLCEQPFTAPQSPSFPFFFPPVFLLWLHIHPACHLPLHPSIKSLPYLTLQIHLGVLRENAARTCGSLIRSAHRPFSSRNDVQIAENKS